MYEGRPIGNFLNGIILLINNYEKSKYTFCREINFEYKLWVHFDDVTHCDVSYKMCASPAWSGAEHRPPMHFCGIWAQETRMLIPIFGYIGKKHDCSARKCTRLQW